MVQFSLLRSADTADLADDIRELFDDLSRTLDRTRRAYSGECHAALDVFETDTAIEVCVDVAGVPPTAVRVLVRGGVLLIVGEKAAGPTTTDQTFHLVERSFGRFARAVRLAGAFDLQNSHATIRHGELVIVLPKIDDRRGRAHLIPIGS
jgi:HSP20 family protein